MKVIVGLVIFTSLRLIGSVAESATAPAESLGGLSVPTNPTPSTDPNPLVKIQMTFDCNPCSNDTDKYMIHIDPGCVGTVCPPSVTATKPVRRHNTVTWVGRLAPGSHTIEPIVHDAYGRVIITFSRGVGQSSGGIRPGSIKMESPGSSGDRQRISRCGVSLITTDPYDAPLYRFDVTLGVASSVC